MSAAAAHTFLRCLTTDTAIANFAPGSLCSTDSALHALAGFSLQVWKGYVTWGVRKRMERGRPRYPRLVTCNGRNAAYSPRNAFFIASELSSSRPVPSCTVRPVWST